MQRFARTALFLLAMATAVSGQGELVSSLKILSFNVWSAEGAQAGRNKLAEIMQTSGADVIGVQELDNGAGPSMAAALGFHYFQQSSGDIQVISRYPIVGQASGDLGVKIQLSPGQEIWLFNSHLAAYPYQPYDLRDGTLPMNEAAVIAAANSARGDGVSSYLSSMAPAIASGLPTFFTGDFNEPSHLDWTAEAAAATPRPFDLEVEYPTSKRVTDVGMIDAFRTVHPDEAAKPGYTWTPGYPPPTLEANEVHDRIDFVYYRGAGVSATAAATVGPVDGNSNTDIAVAGYNADHRAVLATFALSTYLLGDFDSNRVVNAADWSIFRSHQHEDLGGMTAEQAGLLGDLNGDFRNDHADFVLFKNMFEGVNGVGAFAAMAASVPEPASWGPALLMGVAILRLRRSAFSRTEPAKTADVLRVGARQAGKPDLRK